MADKIEVDKNRCKGCGLCIHACPPQIMRLSHHLNTMGYRVATLVDPEGKCNGCKHCGIICPDLAITVFRALEAPQGTP